MSDTLTQERPADTHPRKPAWHFPGIQRNSTIMAQYELCGTSLLQSTTFRYPSAGSAMGTASPAKILLLIPHLGGGGAEHVAATLARCLNGEKYEVHLGLVTQTCREAQLDLRQIPPSVRVRALGARRVRVSAAGILKLVWQIKPDVILSGMAHLNLLVLLLRPFFPHAIPVLVRQNGPLAATLEAGKHPWIARMLFRPAYRSARRVICQTNSMAEEMSCTLNVRPERTVVLPNPIDIARIRASAAQQDRLSHSPPKLLAVCRLAPEKGVDLLLDAFADLLQKFPLTLLHIAGAGPCDSALRAQCALLGVGNSVQFLGHVPCPAHLLNAADVFVLPSRHEGLPNALLEAAAAGLPIVATPSSRGLQQLLRNKPGVWIAKDASPPSITEALSRVLTNLRPGQRFRHSWVEAFDLQPAIRAYEEEIDRSLAEAYS